MHLRFPFVPALLGVSLAVSTPARSLAQPSPVSSMQGSTPIVDRANGASFIRVLGPRAADVFAPTTGLVGALVALPSGVHAEQYGLDPVAPGIGRLRASPQKIDAFSFLHPELRLEVAPPLHPLLNRVGQWAQTTAARTTLGADGTGVLIGIADTGIDVTHPDLIDANGHSRVAWLLDFSLMPLGGAYADLEQKYGIKDDSGNVIGGAVFSGAMIDERLAAIKAGTCVDTAEGKCAPSDDIGHGTHVAGIAASSGTSYTGMAPASKIVFVRVARDNSDGIENDDLMRAVEFLFDRAAFEQQPMVVNLSLGSDFGPHDGTLLWEETIASYVGADHPGHVIVAAAGNSGSIVDSPIHQSVRVPSGVTMRVPVRTSGARSGTVQIWVTLRDGADLKIGLDGPDGQWIAPVASGNENGKNTSAYSAGIINGADLPDSPIPAGSRGAVVVWTGAWPSGTYEITLVGSGMAELYLEGVEDAALGASRPATFANGVREGTITLPATHPSIIGVGCTVNRAEWTSIGDARVRLEVPILDGPGGMPLLSGTGQIQYRDLGEGEVCWFSSAGPTATGVPKPEIAAPGALVISALSRSALPGTTGSDFTTDSCPLTADGRSDDRCLQIDDEHAVASGTSMSSPAVAGVVALLLQRDPTLTQDQVRALLQAGAHRFRGASPFEDQSGPGEVDAVGALDALDLMHDPKLAMPALSQSWITLSSDYVPADGSTSVTAIVELRTEDGAHRADLFDASRLSPVLFVDDASVSPPSISRRGPGVWVYEWKPPPGLGGLRATFGATFDGQPIVAYRTLPIATDGWMASYASHGGGSGCGMHASRTVDASAAIAFAALGLAFVNRRRRPAERNAGLSGSPI
ncbi:MAG: S8 family serine peptidase [Polyangiaceae bacterium]|nr:S8 family serine peptidase [Polyangiaceae bacterium]